MYVPELAEHYHSIHGAIQEARHVFLKMGLQPFFKSENLNEISILEVGFGTGLNAFLTLQEANFQKQAINYTALEAYPVSEEEVAHLNYASFFQDENSGKLFQDMHRTEWEKPVFVTPLFKLYKRQLLFANFSAEPSFDIIYFDAFGPQVQPELWTEDIFSKMFQSLRKNGVLVTYSAKGSVRRAMQAVGMVVERLPGPPGKREMLRALKP